MALAIPAEEQHAPNGGHLAPLVDHDETQRLEFGAAQLAHGRERLGSRSEVQGFRVELGGHRPLVEGLAAGVAA